MPYGAAFMQPLAQDASDSSHGSMHDHDCHRGSACGEAWGLGWIILKPMALVPGGVELKCCQPSSRYAPEVVIRFVDLTYALVLHASPRSPASRP